MSEINRTNFKKVSDIKQGKEFIVFKVEMVVIKYEEKIHMNTEEYFYFPKSWNDRFTLKQMNQSEQTLFVCTMEMSLVVSTKNKIYFTV